MAPPWQRKGGNALCRSHRHLSQRVAARVQITLAVLKTLYWQQRDPAFKVAAEFWGLSSEAVLLEIKDAK